MRMITDFFRYGRQGRYGGEGGLNIPLPGRVGGHDDGDGTIGSAALLVYGFDADTVVSQDAGEPWIAHRADPERPAGYNNRFQFQIPV